MEVGDVDDFVAPEPGVSVPGWRAFLAAEGYVTEQGSAHASHLSVYLQSEKEATCPLLYSLDWIYFQWGFYCACFRFLVCYADILSRWDAAQRHIPGVDDLPKHQTGQSFGGEIHGKA